MKQIFNYKTNYFSQIFAVSLLGHTAVFGGTHFFSLAPDYSVKPDQNSVEVFLVEEPKQQQIKKIEKQEIITSDNKLENNETVVSEEVLEEETKQVPEPVKSDASQGALIQAEPLSIENPAPRYPRIALLRKWEGKTLLKVHVDRDGNPLQVVLQKSSGYRVLDDASIRTIQKWKFVPAHSAFCSIC